MYPSRRRTATHGLTHLLAGALLGTLALAHAAPAAAAGKRVIIMDFSGPSNQSVRAAVLRTVRREHAVVPRAELAAEASKLGIDTACDPSLIPGIAQMMNAEAVLCGSVKGRHRLSLVLRVYNGGDGQVVRTIRTRLGTRGVNTRALRVIRTHIAPALAKTWNWAAADGDDTPVTEPVAAEPPPEPAPVGEVAEADSELPQTRAPATVATRTAWAEVDDENPLAAQTSRPSHDREAGTVQASAAPARGMGEHALRLQAGSAFMFRRNYGVYGAPTERDAQGWQTTPMAGVGVSAEVYPGSWFTDGWASHIGIGASYARYFGLTWRTREDPNERSVTHHVFDVGLRGRYSVDLGFRELHLEGVVGYRYLAFMMNDDATTEAQVPDVNFNSIDLGLGASMAVLPRWLVASARFHYLPTFARGEIATQSQYGSAGGGGMLLGGSLGGALWGPLGWDLSLEYSRYTINFDGDPAAARLAQRARDRYLSGALSVTYTN